jgi:hypothetical protein
VQTCSSFDWQVSDDAPRLQAEAMDSTVRVGVNQSGLGNGDYSGQVTISATGISGVPPVFCADSIDRSGRVVPGLSATHTAITVVL